MNSENKKKTFSRAIRGYDQGEVDAYISAMEEKYAELQREYAELEYRLNSYTAKSKAEEMSEEQIKNTLAAANKTADKIIADAQAQADLLYAAARDNADRVLRSFRQSVAREAIVLQKLKLAVADMRSIIYKQYLQNIEQLENLAPKSRYEEDLNEESTAEYIRAVIDGMKNDVENLRTDSGEEEPGADGRVTITRTPEVTVAKKYRIASVRETIRELNRKIISETESDNGDNNE